MQQYDIRIQPIGGRARMVSTHLPRDPEAIVRARQLADQDDEVEVWRGMACIYRREILPHCRQMAN